MGLDHNTKRIEQLLAENGLLSARAIAEALDLPLGNVRILLYSRDQFVEIYGRWGLRDREVSPV